MTLSSKLYILSHEDACLAFTAAVLKTIHSGNSLIKFADDTYLVIPSANASTRQQEIGHIATWAATNNLKLNVLKTKEIVFENSRRRADIGLD